MSNAFFAARRVETILTGRTLASTLLVGAALGVAACSGSSDAKSPEGDAGGDGGASSGGTGAAGAGAGAGAGGSGNTSGASGAGGSRGGSGNRGGASGNGGATHSGGSPSTGGKTSSGGRSGSGGAMGVGGASGGASGMGGNSGMGGAMGTGGSGMSSDGCGKSSPTGDKLITVQVGGMARTYFLSVPASYAKDKPGPIYFVFHGAGGSHDSVTGLGFQKKFVTVFPDGIDRNGGIGWDESPSSTDVTLFDQALAATLSDYCIDPGKVYTAGFSWGGWIATALGCLRGNVVHGFASVEGGVLNSSKDCKGPVPGWVNHYKDDPAEPYSSGTHEVDFFTALNGAKNPAAYDAPNPCVKYTGNAPFVFCNPEGAVHQWPDYATDAIERFFGAL